MRYFFCLPLLAISASLVSGCITERPGMQDARIRLKDGMPCFSVEANPTTRGNPPLLRGIELTVTRGQEVETLWSKNYINDASPPRISPNECIPYDKNAPELKTRTLYAVMIYSDLWPFFSYFCLLPNEQEQITIRQLGRNELSTCR